MVTEVSEYSLTHLINISNWLFPIGAVESVAHKYFNKN